MIMLNVEKDEIDRSVMLLVDKRPDGHNKLVQCCQHMSRKWQTIHSATAKGYKDFHNII